MIEKLIAKNQKLLQEQKKLLEKYAKLQERVGKNLEKISKKRDLATWLSDYAISHQNPVNKKIHWLCVPTIFASIIGMGMNLYVVFTLVSLALVMLFYLSLSTKLFIAMGMFVLFCLAAVSVLPFDFKIYFAIFI